MLCDRKELRTAEEIERAHDLVLAMITVCGQMAPDTEITMLHVVLDVLCWSLNHGRETQMENVLRDLEQTFRTLHITIANADDVARTMRKAFTN